MKLEKFAPAEDRKASGKLVLSVDGLSLSGSQPRERICCTRGFTRVAVIARSGPKPLDYLPPDLPVAGQISLNKTNKSPTQEIKLVAIDVSILVSVHQKGQRN